MQVRGALPALMLLAVLGMSACDRQSPTANNTAVLGGYGPGRGESASSASLTDARGRPIPAPRAPARTPVQAVRSGDESALAVWVQDGHVHASAWTRDGGWSPARPLEDIYGKASDPQVVSNGAGKAMAVWRHTVGSIQSLRFSRFDQASGWTTPDVMPGALPRPDASAGPQDGPRLEMDAAGNVIAEWASGFNANELQTARWVEGSGWTRAESEPVAAAPEAPATPAPAR